MWMDNTVFADNRTTIERFLTYRSPSMTRYIQEKPDSHFTMWQKSLTHSDLTTRGKRTNSADGFEKNYLYYISVENMNELQRQFPEKKFECAKQSNIGMPEEFYADVGVPRIKRRSGHQKTNHNWISFNDYMNVYLVNDTLKYFNLFYSEKIMKILGKEMPMRWKGSIYSLDNHNDFTEISLHQAVHGLGVEADKTFHALRLSMFLNDTVIFIVEHRENDINLFILLEKNTMFYSLLGFKDKRWADDERIRRFHERMMIKDELIIDLPENPYENEWDNTLLPQEVI